MTYNQLGINYKILDYFIINRVNSLNKQKHPIKKIKNYIGGLSKKQDNPINDLNNIEDIDPLKECALHITGNICFSKEEQQKLINIDKKTQKKMTSMSKIQQHLKCDSQKCVALKMNFDLNNFKHDGPADSTQLLSNVDIDTILSQYEKLFPFFHAINFTMDDWDNKFGRNPEIVELGTNPLYVCNIIRNNKKCIGFIMNTDKWSGNGIHWTAMLIDFRNPANWNIEFFNSSGKPPSKSIKNLIDNIIDNLHLCNAKPIDCTINHINITKHEHQTSDTECGVYCLFYIYNRCKGISSKYFENDEYNRITDNSMISFRKYIFWN